MWELGWNAVGAISGAVSAIAASLGFIFVNRQLKFLSQQEAAQTKEFQHQHFVEYTKRYQDILSQLPSTIGSSDFVLSCLKPSELEQVMRCMRSYFDLCYEEWHLNKRKIIPTGSWDDWHDGMGKTAKKPAFRQAWLRLNNERDTEFGPEFTKFYTKLQV